MWVGMSLSESLPTDHWRTKNPPKKPLPLTGFVIQQNYLSSDLYKKILSFLMCHSNRPIAYYSTEQKQSIQVPVIDNKELLHKYHAENYQHKVNWI